MQNVLFLHLFNFIPFILVSNNHIPFILVSNNFHFRSFSFISVSNNYIPFILLPLRSEASPFGMPSAVHSSFYYSFSFIFVHFCFK